MIAEYISYCCSRAQWETIRLLLNLKVPIGLHVIPIDEHVCRAAYDSLCDQGLLISSGDSVIVDRLLAFLLTEASQADTCLIARGESCHLLLHCTPHMVLLDKWTLDKCVLTPLPTLAAAREPFLNTVQSCLAPTDFELVTIAGQTMHSTASAYTQEALLTLAEKLYNELCVVTFNHREA